MNKSEAMAHPDLKRLVEELTAAAAEKLLSVVLYGSAARGDFHEKTSDLNLILVLDDLSPATLELLSPYIRQWLKKGHPSPRLFTPSLISESADVFPMEMLDLQNCRLVLFGRDPFAGLAVGRAHLRLQCERELRTKLMRLREAYVECHDVPDELSRLLTSSYTTFVAVFRGCLSLLGGSVPLRNAEVVEAFCERAGLAPGPFQEVDWLKRGAEAKQPLKVVFLNYYEQLSLAVEKVDRFGIHGGESR
jgi:predicted nucleotidyltransferase